MQIADAAPIEDLAARLISNASRFARTAYRTSGVQRSLVAFRVLANLEREGRLRIGALAAREHIAQPSMSAVVRQLEAEGLVARAADPGDARAALLAVTDAGREELARFRRAAALGVRPELEALAPEELECLARAAPLLERLANRLAGLPDDPSNPQTPDRDEAPCP